MPTPHTLATPIGIRDLQLDNRVFLAPLAGVSDRPFRRICRAAGAGLVYVEMLSAEAIIHDSKRTFAMMERLSPLDPLIQLKHVAMARALLILQRYEEAANAARLGVAIASDIHYYRLTLIASLALAGHLDEARKEAATFQSTFTDADLINAMVNFRTRDPGDLERFKDGLRMVDMAVD